MDFHRLKYFLAVVEHRHFSRAAEYCHVSQPSLSQQIRKLEQEVGEELFRRSRDSIELTDFGMDFLGHARSIMAEVKAAEDFVSQNQTHVEGELRIGAIPTVAPYLLPPLIEAFRREHNRVQINVMEETTEHLIDMLRHGVVDFALMSPPTAIDDDAESLLLSEDELLLAVPPDASLARTGQATIDTLSGEPLILLKEMHCLNRQSLAICERGGITPRVSIRSSQIDTVLALVEIGMGVSFIPRMALPFHRKREVAYLSISPEIITRRVQLMWLRRHRLTRLQEAFLTSIRTAKV